MPLFEYTCRKCGHTFEALIFGEETVACPHCQSSRVDKLLSVPAPPQAAQANLPPCGGPPCGAPWCQRQQ